MAATEIAYPVGWETAQRELHELFDRLADDAINVTVEWRFPEPMRDGYPNRAVAFKVSQGYLTWAVIAALTRWAEGPGRDFSFQGGALVLAYQWVEEEVDG